jgi:hypothetical protein
LDLGCPRVPNHDELETADSPTGRHRPRHEPVRPGREPVAADPRSEPNSVDAAVASHPEMPYAAAVGSYLEDDEIDEPRLVEHEDERRSTTSRTTG